MIFKDLPVCIEYMQNPYFLKIKWTPSNGWDIKYEDLHFSINYLICSDFDITKAINEMSNLIHQAQEEYNIKLIFDDFKIMEE